MSIWYCKIGTLGDHELPPGADSPMRQAAQGAYTQVTGQDPDFCFSGWGADLTEGEGAVVKRKVVINTRIGGFGLSDRGMQRFAELAGTVPDAICWIGRDDPALVQAVEELGQEAADKYCVLKVVELPGNSRWYVYMGETGIEEVHEEHRVWV